MGKIKRRHKLHISTSNGEKQNENNYDIKSDTTLLPLTSPKADLFADVNLDFEIIKNNLPDDTQSVKSYKSVKSNMGGHKILQKKEKIKIRRQLLLQKIDSLNQMKKEIKLREKRKRTAVIGDTNPLHDALPSLESLLNSRTSIQHNLPTQTSSNKGIMKTNKRKKKFVQDVGVYKQTLKSSHFKKNPFEAISRHIKSVVEQDRKLLISKKT